ncbi:hypothetical protein CDAR_456461 [Caerostris darwini]|uniref:DUF2442 domain-containing protein n=1 Tax=Caerostris darwini TaxID=1538125 RepID=A0AAV4P275_9ARAC|nr:hypothetical protein CDAR_456461 [Caerostris darwini]
MPCYNSALNGRLIGFRLAYQMRSKLALVACGKGGLVWQVAVSGAGIVQSDWLIDEGAFAAKGATVQWADGILTATFEVMVW